MTQKEASQPNDDYELLCNWHTARLRMLSNRAFTPAALIDADREALELLVQQSLREQADDRGVAQSDIAAVLTRDGKLTTSGLSRTATALSRRPLLSLVVPAACLAIVLGMAMFDLVSPLVAAGVTTSLVVLLALLLYEQNAFLSTIVTHSRRLAERLGIAPLSPGILASHPLQQVNASFDTFEAAVTEGRVRERAITENSTDIICALTADFDIAAINPAVQALWGYSGDKLLGQSLLPFFLDSQSVLKLFERFRSNRQGGIVEVRVKRADGTIGDALCVVQWSEAAQRYFCVAKDTTSQKEVERLRRQLVDMVSHDLRTPLTSVVASLSLIGSEALGPLSESALKEVQTAESSVTQLICLINDLLDIEKWEAGKVSLDCGQIALMPVFERAHDMIGRHAAQHSIDIEIEQTELEVYADADRLVQVLVNLISNAIKFSPKQSVVKVTAKAIDQFTEIRVIDKGRGIPVAHLSSVFERFHQVESSDGQIERGMGLGLAICKRIVDSLGGTIGVESTEGEGSQFWLRIPAAK